MNRYKSKVVIFGCKSTTMFLIENLYKLLDISYLITIPEYIGQKNEVADYLDLTSFCHDLNIPVYSANNYSLKTESIEEFFKINKFDIGFVMGWQRLIPSNILETFSIGVFGMHGSSMNLPLGRGRSPMNWAIIEGRKQFYTCLFKYDAGVDSGDILDLCKFNILEKDTGETMHYKNSLSMIYLIKKNIDSICNKTFVLRKQNELIEPTYYPKRNPSDSLIDWSQDLNAIERFIRAVAPPFSGAFTFINSKEKMVIYNAQIFDYIDFGFNLNIPGEVVHVFPSKKFLVNCFGGLLLVNHFECDIIPKSGDVLNNGSLKIHYFIRNKHGNFDLPE